MGDQVAAIAAGVREILAAPPQELCATFAVRGDDTRWVQYMANVINAAYPHTADPRNFATLLEGKAVTFWEAGGYLTLDDPSTDAAAIAAWIDRYFLSVLSSPADYALDVTLENFGG